jgi:hypothetical protein
MLRPSPPRGGTPAGRASSGTSAECWTRCRSGSSSSSAAAGLRDLQKGACFYCGNAIRGEGGAVDHFIPWSRYPLDLGHNFVLAHAACNGDKRDMLAAVGHLERWFERNDIEEKALVEVFNAARFPFDADASSSIALWAYENAERAQAQLWVRCTGETASFETGWKEWFK